VRLTGAGISMGDLSGNAEENMNTMIQLRETFELSQDEIQRLAGSMKVTGGSITDLAGVAVQFQKDFKVPGLINTLPAAAEAAVEAQSRFGTVVGKSSRDITTNIMRMTGTYSRALGVTAAEAANKARKTFMKFTGEIESFECVRAQTPPRSLQRRSSGSATLWILRWASASSVRLFATSMRAQRRC
jgi:hypothetical protein